MILKPICGSILKQKLVSKSPTKSSTKVSPKVIQKLFQKLSKTMNQSCVLEQQKDVELVDQKALVSVLKNMRSENRTIVQIIEIKPLSEVSEQVVKNTSKTIHICSPITALKRISERHSFNAPKALII